MPDPTRQHFSADFVDQIHALRVVALSANRSDRSKSMTMPARSALAVDDSEGFFNARPRRVPLASVLSMLIMILLEID